MGKAADDLRLSMHHLQDVPSQRGHGLCGRGWGENTLSLYALCALMHAYKHIKEGDLQAVVEGKAT